MRDAFTILREKRTEFFLYIYLQHNNILDCMKRQYLRSVLILKQTYKIQNGETSERRTVCQLFCRRWTNCTTNGNAKTGGIL